MGSRFLLVPGETSHWGEADREEGRLPLRLSRGRAFGSGLHETTISCVEAVEGIGSLKERSVLDVGTGTGILSLAALLLGASFAVGLDIEGDAVRTCLTNARINGLNGRLVVFRGTLDALKRSCVFDLVLANIHGDIILREAHRLSEATGDGGHLVLSGLDYTDNRPLKVAMAEKGMEAVSVRFLGDFVTQVWRRPRRQDERELGSRV